MLCFSFVTKEPHKATKWNPINCIFGSPQPAYRKRARWVSDAKFLHVNAEYFGGNKMTELVHYNQKDQNENHKKCGEHTECDQEPISASLLSKVFSNSSLTLSMRFCSSSFN